MRILRAIVLGTLISMLAGHVVQSGTKTPDLRGVLRPYDSNPPPVRVELWRSGLLSGYTKIDLPTRSISALGAHLGQGRGFHAMWSTASTSEIRALSQGVLDARLFRFSPRREWLKNVPGADGGMCIMIAWRDSVAVFRVLPRNARGKMPQSARQKYDRMDAVVEAILRMEARYSKQAGLKPVGESDPRRQRLAVSGSSVFANSLP